MPSCSCVLQDCRYPLLSKTRGSIQPVLCRGASTIDGFGIGETDKN